MSTTTKTEQATTLGSSVPPFTAHAVSVSLPTWRDNVGYEEGERRVVDSMVTGYPRFFIHKTIQKLAANCERKFGVGDERCLLFMTRKIADSCRLFMIKQSPNSPQPIPVRLIQYLVEDDKTSLELHIVLFPNQNFSLAKQFWQHTGLGISSRYAERCLSLFPEISSPAAATLPKFSKPSNRHYSVKASSPPPQMICEDLETEHGVYLEERYGRNLPLSSAPYAKRALRRRIAGVLVHDDQGNCGSSPCAGGNEVELGPSSRGSGDITEDDVFLYPCGMTAIWQAHQLALLTRPTAKSVCFGFPYTDTLKILQKWGPGCHFFGHGLDSDVDTLETLLADTASPAILALFCEFPSNPLLRSPNMPRLRALADKYDFLIVVDETIGNFVNVDVLPYADIVVSSLTKVFSGDSNVMGGSLILNPRSRHFASLKASLAATYEDVYFDEDAIFMERNSRDFKKRVHIINENAEAVCEYLHACAASGSSVVKDVFYPKWVTRENYDVCRHRTENDKPNFGCLFSVTFSTLAASSAFFDALPCHKGPSLGTNFTLACPYTILAHYTELDWAGRYGVEEGLVRVSVGLEERTTLVGYFETAVKAAEAAVA